MGLNIKCFPRRRRFRSPSIYVIVILLITLYFTYNYTRDDIILSNTDPVNLAMEDPLLISYIRNYKMVPPSKEPYNMENVNLSHARNVLNNVWMGSNHFWSDAVILAQMLIPKEKRTYRFFECGASDGEFMSQTYFAERFLNWTGILVEADPYYFNRMVAKNRKATQIGAGVSTSRWSSTASFLHTEKGYADGKEYVVPGNGRILDGKSTTEPSNGSKIINVFCVPVYSILLAANFTSFDIFFLDIEGPELEVLETIPFDLVDISIFVVEHNSVAGKLALLEDFFTKKGYVMKESSEFDSLFIRQEYLAGVEIKMTQQDFFQQLSNWNSFPSLRE